MTAPTRKFVALSDSNEWIRIRAARRAKAIQERLLDAFSMRDQSEREAANAHTVRSRSGALVISESLNGARHRTGALQRRESAITS